MTAAMIAENERLARAEYLAGRIDTPEFERALEHIYAGGTGGPHFPYLPMFEMPEGHAAPR